MARPPHGGVAPTPTLSSPRWWPPQGPPIRRRSPPSPGRHPPRSIATHSASPGPPCLSPVPLTLRLAPFRSLCPQAGPPAVGVGTATAAPAAHTRAARRGRHLDPCPRYEAPPRAIHGPQSRRVVTPAQQPPLPPGHPPGTSGHAWTPPTGPRITCVVPLTVSPIPHWPLRRLICRLGPPGTSPLPYSPFPLSRGHGGL